MAQASELGVGPEARSKAVLTIYGNGLALIRDVRTVDLAPGAHRVAFSGVSRSMIPSSAAILSAGDGLSVRAIEYDFDVISADALLRRFVGREVGIVRVHPTTGAETVEPATVLAVDSGVVLRYRDRIETGAPGRIVFDQAPDDLRAFPTLVAAVGLDAPADTLELRYVTHGLSWSADYIVTLQDETSTLSLDARATLTNITGVDFADAEIALIAGQVNEATPPSPFPAMAMARMAESAPMPASAPPPVSQEAFADLHLYTIGEPVTLADQQTKQIALMGGDGIAFRRTYISSSSVATYGPVRGEPVASHPIVRLSFDNTEKNALGAPLPAGLVRVYTTDSRGNVRLLGEDTIQHMPVGRTVHLSPGQAFDLSVTRRQTDFKRLSTDNKLTESAWAIEIANAKAEAATVRIVEYLSDDWEILDASAAHNKPQADRAEWEVTVPAGEAVTLTYRVRVRR